MKPAWFPERGDPAGVWSKKRSGLGRLPIVDKFTKNHQMGELCKSRYIKKPACGTVCAAGAL